MEFAGHEFGVQREKPPMTTLTSGFGAWTVPRRSGCCVRPCTPLVGQGGDIAFDVLNGRMVITRGSGASGESAIIAAVRPRA